MTSFSELLAQGSSNLWLFIPSAVLLGALHGLEPGHSKTMMAAFIIAIRGTVAQAVLLGVSAAASHTLIVWIVALAGLHFGAQLDNERTEAWFQLASGLLIVAIAVWMLLRIHGEQQAAQGHHHHDAHDHDHDHDHDHHHDGEAMDAHARAHAEAIERRFADTRPGTGQIVLFGLTGGLAPCPASITVLLLCLQLKEYTLGLTLVLGFSLGLALVMVLSGVLAALSVRAARQRFAGFGRWAARAPYLSSALIIVVGLISIQIGWNGLQGT